MDKWMVLRESRREEKGKTYEHGDESAAIKLRHDSALVQHAVGVSLLASVTRQNHQLKIMRLDY
jgi:hypothetical protein